MKYINDVLLPKPVTSQHAVQIKALRLFWSLASGGGIEPSKEPGRLATNGAPWAWCKQQLGFCQKTVISLLFSLYLICEFVLVLCFYKSYKHGVYIWLSFYSSIIIHVNVLYYTKNILSQPWGSLWHIFPFLMDLNIIQTQEYLFT